jgi:hypothetical protein
MAETTEIIRLQLQADQFAVQIQRQKDHIKDLNNQLKQTDITLKQKKQLIIDKAGAEKALKELQSQAKNTTKAIQNAGAGAEISGKSFLKMGLMMTGAIGAGRGLVELLKNLFKNSEVFQKINNAISDFGKTVSSMVDDFLGKFVSGLKSAKDLEFEKSLEKIREKSIENIASFEVLARQVENLGSKLEPTATEQLRYSKAVEELKKQYPEYLSLMSTEIENHKENISLLEIKRRMLFDEIKRKVIVEELEVAIRAQIKAERELKDNDELRNTALESWVKLYNANNAAREKVLEVEKRYNEEMSKTVTAEAMLANAKATAALKAGDEKRAKEAATKALEEEAKATDNLTKKVEAYDKARLKSMGGQWREVEIKHSQILEYVAVKIQEVINKYDELQVKAPELAVTFEEVWSSIFQGVGSIANLTLEEWSKTMNFVDGYVQNMTTIFDNMYQSQINKAESARDAKIAALEQEYASTGMLQEEYEKKKLKIEQDSEKKLRALKKKQQTLDVLKTTSSGISASIESFKNAGGWPVGIVPAAVMTGIWMSAVDEIKSQKLALGGVANGPSHAAGGIQIGGNQEIEGGEGIINKRSMSNPYLYSAASMINQAGGGVAFPGTRNMATGGVTYSFMGSSTARIERLLEALNRNVAGLELSLEINNSTDGSIDKIASEVTKRQNRFTEKGGNLAGL